MTRILLMTSSSYPHTGGLSSHIESLKKGFEELNLKVDVISTSFPGPVYKVFVRGPIKILNKFDKFFSTFWYIFSTKQIQGGYLLLKQITNRYDVIYAQTVVSYNATYLIRKIFKIPVILVVHHYLAYEAPGEIGIDKNFLRTENFLLNEERKAYTSSDIIVTVDSRLKNYLIEKFHLNENKINVIINSVDVQEFKPRYNKKYFRNLFNLPENNIIIICPRRLVKKNGVIYAAQAMKYIQDTYKTDSFILVYAGDGPEKDEISAFIKKYDMKHKVIFLGSVRHNEMKYLYNASDIVVIPSIYIGGVEEATSISALEAMASGVPVIATRIGGLKEIIKDKETGFLIEEKNIEELGNTIYQLSIMDTKNITKNSRNYVVENCSHIRKAKQFLSLYNKSKKYSTI